MADTTPSRLTSLDAYRGFVMFLMVAEALHLPRIARNFADNPFWQFVANHTTHKEWIGCSLHDLIQPSFSFIVGVAVPYSVASRIAKGQPFRDLLGHAVFRSILLIALGIFLRSVGRKETNYTFEDTLTQIGLGYTFLFVLAFGSSRTIWTALGLILFGYWLAFALYPAPGPNYSWPSVGVAADWPHHLTGFAQHWDKNSNLAAAFDRWLLNLFPREKPFLFNGGGYVTLSFIPTLATMVLGLITGRMLRTERAPGAKMRWLLQAGAACLAGGVLLHLLGICPMVKRIWTPSWTLYSGGWALLLLAAFYGVMEIKGIRAWAYPFIVIGLNSITIYCLAHLIDGFIVQSYSTHLGAGIFNLLGPAWAPLLSGVAVVLTLWLILWWMHRHRIYLKI